MTHNHADHRLPLAEYDTFGGSWNPKSLDTTISFRGQQARYTFPVGVTTLWWFAPAN
jgi:hypothetical protein